MYEKPSKYRYSVGILGYLLVILSLVYVIIWICYYCDVFVNIAYKAKSDEIINTLIIWSALKPAVALFVGVYVVLTLYDPVTMFVLVVICGVIWAGTVAINIKILVDRFASCNRLSNSYNLCNDLLYCCVYYDSVPRCAGLGPCGNLLNDTLIEIHDLKVNPDFHELAIFNGIFVFLELFLLLTLFGVLLRLKKIGSAAILTNKLLGEYYSDRENEEYENILNESDESTEQEEQDEQEKNEKTSKTDKMTDVKTQETIPSEPADSPSVGSISLKSTSTSFPINENAASIITGTSKPHGFLSDGKRRKIRSNITAHSTGPTMLRTVRQKKIKCRPRGEVIQISQETTSNSNQPKSSCCNFKETKWLPDKAIIHSKCHQFLNKIKETSKLIHLFVFYHIDTFTIREILVKRSNDKIFYTKFPMPLYKKR